MQMQIRPASGDAEPSLSAGDAPSSQLRAGEGAPALPNEEHTNSNPTAQTSSAEQVLLLGNLCLLIVCFLRVMEAHDASCWAVSVFEHLLKGCFTPLYNMQLA